MVTCTTRVNRPFGQGNLRVWIWPVLTLLILVLATVPAVAQTATGNISGYVKDTSGASCPPEQFGAYSPGRSFHLSRAQVLQLTAVNVRVGSFLRVPEQFGNPPDC